MNLKLDRAVALIAIVVGILMLVPVELVAQRRPPARQPAGVRRPVHRTKVVVRTGHPIRRAFPGSVAVRAARRSVIVSRPLVFLPLVAWRRRVVVMPVGAAMAWQDSESIAQNEEWVDTNFGIDQSGTALILEVGGKATLNFAEITFANGNVQVIDFDEKSHESGVYELLAFPDGRHVSTVRLLAKSETDETKLSMYLSK